MILSNPLAHGSDAPFIGGGDHDKVPHGRTNSSIIGGGDHDYKWKNLTHIIGGDDHDKVPHGNNKTHIIGGDDHDRIPHGRNNTGIIGGGDHDYSWKNKTKKFGGDDHDYVPHGNSTNIIGGGDHDYSWKNKTKNFGGDDHDYVPHGNSTKIIGGDDHDRVPHGRNNTGIIGGGDHDYSWKNKTINSTHIIGGDDHDKVPHGRNNTGIIGGGDHDYSWKNNTIIGGDDHDKVPHGRNNTGLIGGGDHDYSWQHATIFGNNTQIIGGGDHDYSWKNKTIIGGDDHDLVPHGNSTNSTSTVMLLAENAHEAKKFDADYIWFHLNQIKQSLKEKSLEELKTTALKMEEYERKKTGPLMGGLHDYIDTLTKEDLTDYILKKVFNNQELLEIETFNTVSKETSTESNNVMLLAEKAEEPKKFDADYIWFHLTQIKQVLKEKSIEELKTIALNVEEFERKKTGPLMGGLHDYINTLTKEDLTDYIVKGCFNNKELLDMEVFNTVASGHSSMLTFLSETNPKFLEY